MSTSVSNSGAGSSGQANFSSSPTDPELDPQAAEKALEALNDPQIKSIRDVMAEFYSSYYGGPPSESGGGGDYSKENWDWATSHGVKPWWQTYEPIAGYDDNVNFNADLWDQNAVNAPTVKLWACFFGVKTGYCDPSYEGPGPFGGKGTYYHDPMWNVQDSNVQDSVSKMIQALKGKIDIIDTNILGVSGDPSKVQKLNALRCQIQTGLNAAIKLDNWRNAVAAWITRAFGDTNHFYDMLKPDKYSGDYYTGHLGPLTGHFDPRADTASDREAYLYSTLNAGPNNSDPFPRPPFDPFELALTCFNSVDSLVNPW